MTFIPIVAKADIDTNDVIASATSTTKKGKITPSQLSQVFAWSLTEKVGILDCLNKCQISPLTQTLSNNQVNVTIKKGFISIYGHIIENTGTTITFNKNSDPTDGRLVLRVRLANSKNSEYDIIKLAKSYQLTQNDLNENSISGIYEFVLYDYKFEDDTVVFERPTTTKYIADVNGRFSQFETSLVAEGKPLYNYDIQKGTIEERLTKLGFNSGIITFNGASFGFAFQVSTSDNGIYRQGNFVFCRVAAKYTSPQKLTTGFSQIEKLYRPKQATYITVSMNTFNNMYAWVTYLIKNDGTVTQITSGGDGLAYAAGSGYNELYINFGYEVDPL